MKNILNTLYWIGILLVHIAAFGLLSFIVGLALGFSDTLIGGISAYGFIICGLLFGADDEDRDLIKKLIIRDGGRYDQS